MHHRLHRIHSIWLVGLPFMMACESLEVSGADRPGPGLSGPKVSETQSAVTLADRITACNADPRVIAGLVSVDICVGADLFFRETFAGNGRSCGTCHPASNNFTIDPKFIATLAKTDPLFIAENDPNLIKLEDPQQLRGRSLIIENVDGFLSDVFNRFVLRSVPHTLSMSTSITTPPGAVTPPVHRTGWSGDGAPGSGALRDFQTGAIKQHYPKTRNRVTGVDFRLADAGELDRIDLFMRSLGRTNELNLTNVRMFDARAEAGRQAFLTVGCNACHGNAGANATFAPGNFNFNTGVETARTNQLTGTPKDGGFGTTSDPNGQIFGDGTFNTPPLIEAADTGPFFHVDTTISGASGHNTMSASTIEEAIAFYDSPAFNNSPSGQVAPINLTATQIDDIGRFLRSINAQFNIAIALKRLNGAMTLVLRFGDQFTTLQRAVIQLALDEVLDAIEVLQGQAGLNQQAVDTLQRSIAHCGAAIAARNAVDREGSLEGSLEELNEAITQIGFFIDFTIGSGMLMF
jgi:Cytochrome c